MSHEFLRRAADVLSAAGLDAKFDGIYLNVKGCKFNVDAVKTDPATGEVVRVKFLGSHFKFVDGEADWSKVAGKIAMALPELMKERADREARSVARNYMLDLGNELGGKVVTSTVPKYADEVELDCNFRLQYSEKGVEVVFSHPDPERVKGALGAMRAYLASSQEGEG